MLALFVNLLFVAVLVFSVSWQNRKPEAVTAELYAPPAPQHAKATPEPPAEAEPPPARTESRTAAGTEAGAEAAGAGHRKARPAGS